MRVLELLRRSADAPRPSALPAAAVPASAGSTELALDEAIRSIARQASTIGRGAAEVRGLIDDTTKNSARSAEAVASLGAQVGDVHRAQDAIGAVSADALGAVGRVREALGHVGGEVGAVVTTLREVSSAAETITQIALQTRLVAFNASVEAKRAGDAGRGFGVVADAVKDLAARVEDSSKEIMRTVVMLDRRIEALAAELRVDGRGEGGANGRAATVADPAAKRHFQRALAEVEVAVGRTREAAAQSAGICAGLDAQMAGIGANIGGTARTLGAAMRHSETFLEVSESLIELVARCGIETDDTPFIHTAIEAAGRVGALLEEALASRATSVADLFDTDYRPIPGTQPAQCTTRFVAIADRLFPAVQEAVLQSSPKVVFCIAVDRNGYVPTHNRAYCQPQRGDLAWDTANSRYRRIFDDRTGLASARNERPFLLQTYRRDMGGSQYIVMKEASAPIRVHGRHWGGLRVAFKF